MAADDELSRDVPQADLATGLRELVRMKRKELGLSQRALAAIAGLSDATIASVEQGRRNPTDTVLAGLARAFEMDSPAELRQLAARWHLAIGDEGRKEVLSELDVSEELLRGHSGSSRARRPRELGELPRVLNALRAADQERAESVISWLDHVGSELASSTPLPDPDRLQWALDVVTSEPVRDLDPDQRDRLLDLLHRLSREPNSNGLPRIATVPAGQVHYIFANDLAIGEDGELWVDPLARAYPSGLDPEDPRFERWDDGRVRVDTSLLASTPAWAERNPSRHVLRVDHVGAVGSPREELEPLYRATVIDVLRDDRTIPVSPADGSSGKRLPDGVGVVHIITASNPRSRLLSDAENRERNRLLSADIDRLGWEAWPATAHSPDGSWSEESHAVFRAPTDEVLALAARNEQTAIFRWNADGVEVLWVDEDG